MTLGPLEYIEIGFEGNNFNGSIANEISRVVENGTIRIVDAVFVTKDVEGETAILEIDAKDDPRFAGFAALLGDSMALLTPEDVATLAERLPTNTSALVLLFEHRWAVRIKEAMAEAGGFLVAREVIPPEVLEAVNAELEAAVAEAAIEAGA